MAVVDFINTTPRLLVQAAFGEGIIKSHFAEHCPRGTAQVMNASFIKREEVLFEQLLIA